MSWLFSRALVAASLGDISLDGGPCALSSGTDTPQAFLWPDRMTAASRRSRSGMTCEPLTDARGEAVWMWCLEASLAKTSRSPAPARGCQATGAPSGSRWPASFAKWDHATSSWRTPQCSIDGGSTVFSGIWPRWGSMRSGACTARSKPELLTSDSGRGLWPRIPTPTAGDSKSSGSRNTPQSRAHGGMSLTDFVRQDGGRGRIPTPAATDWKGSAKEGQRRGQLTDPAMGVVPAGGRLSPTWVEWLMGWPLGWTDCDASATDRFREWCASHGVSSQTEGEHD